MNQAPIFDSKKEALETHVGVKKPNVTIVVPGYNESFIIEENLFKLCEYMKSQETEYKWELIFVNDGSTDGTGDIAETFAKTRNNVHILHHISNFRLGEALRSAFYNCNGDYVVTMDADLSYSPDHIGKLLAKIRETKAKIVIASPYMKGGKVSNVPWGRKILSKWANRYLSFTSNEDFSTLTGMVRVYDATFLRTLDLKSKDSEINEEIIYKAQMLGARIVEIPAHLDWSYQKAVGESRRSSLKIYKKIISCLFSGFIFRPFMFFVIPGFVIMLLSFYPLGWAFVHTFNHYHRLSSMSSLHRIDYLFSDAVSAAFLQSPHSFLVGGFALMFALQLVSLGILALQNKRYFEDLFHISTTIYKFSREDRQTNH